MFDDTDDCEGVYESNVIAASKMLAQCIARARAGLPTGSPSGLVWRSGMKRKTNPWMPCEIEDMRLMRDEGLSVREIAEALDRTHESIKDGIRRHLRGFSRDGRMLQEPAE